MSKIKQCPSIFEFEDASQWLESVYTSRKNKNPSYSLRSFAQALEVTHTVLTRLFQNKTRLSPETAKRIAEKLGLNELEQKYFQQIVLAAPNRALLDQFRVQASSHKVEYAYVSEILKLKTIALLQIIEKSKQDTFQVDIAARKLSIPVEEVKGLLRKLKHHGMIELKNGQPRGTGKRMLFETTEAKKSLTDLYKSGYQMAERRLDQHQPDERVIGSEFLTFDPSDLGEASQLINECLNRLVALSRRSKNSSDVYYCNTTMFRVTEKGDQSA